MAARLRPSFILVSIDMNPERPKFGLLSFTPTVSTTFTVVSVPGHLVSADAHISVSDVKDLPTLKNFYPMSSLRKVDLPDPVLPKTANLNFFY